jgi:carbon monoxide dehydrogenase subunit G
MIHNQRTLIINATPEIVWSVLGRFMHVDEFAPMVTSVDALTDGQDRVGSRRRCHFQDGSSMIEEVTEWQENRKFRVQLQDTAPMPLNEGYAQLTLVPVGNCQTQVVWTVDFHLKYGPLGWVLGMTLLKMMMGKIINANLQGLAKRVAEVQALARPESPPAKVAGA